MLVTHDRFMLERLSTELLALDGEGGAGSYASLAQWEAAREERSARALAESRTKAGSAKPQAAVAPAKKRLTWNEQRELEKMEGQILEAESELESLQHAMADPAVASDHEKMRDVCTRADAAQRRVSDLYHRWQELEAKRS